PLAVGLGIYLPTSSTLMIVVGAVAGWFYDRRADRTPRPEAAKQLGVLLASGLIVGEGIIAVVISLIKAFSSKPAPLALVGPDGVLAKSNPLLANFETAGIVIGGGAFVVITFVLYRWILRMATARST
ncbi:MAG TPA: OPT/YSL family transporter, partial [Candidatus Tectomicrobia bacterium]|nr:OPT/YSL family transporter [Candidatus Tectomicrobia bacterium]